MKSIVGALGVALLLGALRPAAAGQMELAQPDAAGFPRIQLYVYPTGDRGDPISGASAQAFEVHEGNHVVSLDAFHDATQAAPVDVCLTIDRSGSMVEESKLQSAQQAAVLFLRSMRPADRAALVSFADRPTLNRSLTHDAAGAAQAVQTLGAYGGTALYDAVYWSVNQVALAPKAQGSVLTTPARSEARRVVLALTDGIDNRSQRTPQQVVALARANGVTIYTIGLGSDAQSDPLVSLAKATGGRYFAAPGPEALAQLYALVAQQLHSEYALAYRSPDPRTDGSRREVTVTFRSAEGTISASGWYQAPGAGSSVLTFGTPGAPAPPSPPLSGAGSPAPGRTLPIALWLAGGMVAAAAIAAYLLRIRRAPAPEGAALAYPRESASVSPLEAAAAAAEPDGEEAEEPEALPEEGSDPVSGAAGTDIAPSSEQTETGPPLLQTNPRLDLRPLWVRAPVTVVGRAEGNDLILNSPLVSRRHARIERADGEFRLVDVGSANGTYLNGERVTEAPLSIGDIIRFADQEFRFAGEQTTS